MCLMTEIEEKVHVHPLTMCLSVSGPYKLVKDAEEEW